ncbi:NeuD/PglB/VioB family sugar acetyltransferase [Anaerobacillus sp. CMMVII]|uniref:NeuD/PglB/VioB family sugar acetyltransferase n=1 Tax=Anaerobacillus sp. CMMVII TaxID=2755588 RepID=UPI0021B7330C|nr:NeuD/PglB/VioB family sugar acetyltransferase [Anaerobacillus sp. CMMVII]MCT8140345.1 NeuD/PglB/VioB family sugar acetyltransferase [Anaerobacillus sp. CMMVII]
MNTIESWYDQTLPGEKIIVIGSGSLGKLTVDCILGNRDFSPNNIAILDDDLNTHGKKLLGVPVVGTVDQAQILSNIKGISFVIAIANNKIRKKIANDYPDLNFRSIISNKATISQFSNIGKGSIVLPGVVVDPDACIKEHVIVNKASTIAHDVILQDFSQVSPGVNFGGFVVLGECSFIGLGASVLPSIKIAKNVVIGAGAVVTKDIDISSTVFIGNPAKLLKKNET